MAGSARIPGNFPALLSRLAVTDPQLAFDLLGVVLPVAIVDAVSIPVTVVPPLYTSPASAGELVAPGAGTVLADTGQLAAGSWIIRAHFSNNTGNATLRFGKRDAANAAFVWSVYISTTTLTQYQFLDLRCSVALNERVRMECIAAVAGTCQGVIFAVQAT